jgi:hypothetical protein
VCGTRNVGGIDFLANDRDRVDLLDDAVTVVILGYSQRRSEEEGSTSYCVK